MTTPFFTERRSTKRYPLPLRATLRVLIPEDTFSALEFHAVADDVSANGCRLRVNKMPRHTYQQMLPKLRHVKLQFEFTHGQYVEVRGKTVWLDYHDKEAETSHCLLGVLFDTVSPQFQAELDAAIHRYNAMLEDGAGL